MTSDLQSFWDSYAKKKLNWSQNYKSVLEAREELEFRNKYYSPWIWFKDGQLDIKKTFFHGKYSEDIMIKSYSKNEGIIEIKYGEFLKKSIDLTNKLISNNFEKVLIIGSACPSTSLIMVSTALSGKCHSVLFEDLSKDSIIKRIEIFNPSIIFIRDTVDEKKFLELKNYSNSNGLEIETYSDLFQNKIYKNNENIKCEELDSFLQLPNTKVNANESLFCLFTSGSTGTPKAIWHSYGGYLLYSIYTFEKYFSNAGAKKSIFCGTDAAWINGHTYAVYGPLLNNTISIFIDNLSNLQNPQYLEEFIINSKLTFFYASVTLLRAIKSYASITKTEKVSKKDTSLVGIGSCGEPLANDVALWAINFFNSKNDFVVNTYFQTETGGVIVAPDQDDPYINDYSTVGIVKFPLRIQISNEHNSLIIVNPWPGSFDFVLSDKKPIYWTNDKKYILHDSGYKDQNSFLYIGGRTDDVINVSGHRISSAEIESASIAYDEAIMEAAAVGCSDPITGSKVVLFYVLNKQTSIDNELLKVFIVNKLTPNHMPWKVIKIKCLPKTKSGKIARRLLRRVIDGNKPSNKEDLSTIINYGEFLDSLNLINF
tara:strand:- start:1622 stop:3412 length:1791 start_codon:yes stop_codon:yes gene_type:complete